MRKRVARGLRWGMCRVNNVAEWLDPQIGYFHNGRRITRREWIRLRGRGQYGRLTQQVLTR